MAFKDDCAVVAEALAAFEAESRAGRLRVINQVPMREMMGRLDLARLIEGGGLQGERLRRFLGEYLAASTRLQHPGYMSHQVAVPQPASALAALVDGFTNNAMAIYEMGPAAATVEMAIVNWMLDKIGWRPQPLPGGAAPDGVVVGGGVLTHGGSLANLTALSAARARVAPESFAEGTPRNLVIVASPASHYSIARSAGILGLGQKAVRHAPTDDGGRIVAGRLGGCLARLAEEGSVVLAVVANACSTALGLYDPIRAIAEVCGDAGAWLHVDGAHGASALVSRRRRGLLDGVELADSLIWDAHKMLRTSTLCAGVLVRDGRDLDHAFREDASYLFHDKDQPGFDFIHRTVECTKSALGLKALFALAAEGEGAIERTFDGRCDLAEAVADHLAGEDGVEVAVKPQTNIVCFRVAGDDELQLELRRRLTQAGMHYISSTEAKGRRWLRLALMNPATGIEDVRSLMQEIRRHLADIAHEPQGKT